MIAALFVATGGAYFGLDGVDPWDEKRDARKYAGPWPVVAHPPCARWSMLAAVVEARYGHKRGEDGGCFASALASVRKWGGVLEHPASSTAWRRFGLNQPPRTGGWVNADFVGGWTAFVEQGHWGHLCRKPTWLYAAGDVVLPSLTWGKSAAKLRVRKWKGRPGRPPQGDFAEIPKRLRSGTPPAFRDLLLSIARGVR